MGKGQASAELIALSGVVLIMGLFLFQLYAQHSEGTRIFAISLEGQRVANDVARAISHAWLAGNGSVAHSRLPDSMPDGVAYNVTIRGRQVLVFYSTGATTRIASAGVITGNVTPANFTMVPGSGGAVLNITNINGTMRVVG